MKSKDIVELKLRQYFENSIDLYCEIDQAGTFFYVNQTWENVLGYSSNELIGHNFSEFLHPDDIERSVCTYSQEELPPNDGFQNRYRHKNGVYVTLLWSGHKYPQSPLTYAHARDVTVEMRKAELLGSVAAIQEIYMRHGNSLNHMFGQILEEVLKATNSPAGFIGECRSNDIGVQHDVVVHAKTSEFELKHVQSLCEQSIESGSYISITSPIDENLKSIFSIPIFHLGQCIGVLGVANRIGGYDTDFFKVRKPLIEAIASVLSLCRASMRELAMRERFQVIVENLPIMLTEYGADGRITWANKYFCKKIGRSMTDILTNNVLDDVFPNETEKNRAKEFMLSGRTDWEDFFLENSHGEKTPSTWTNIRLKDGRAIGIGQDLTDRRIAEAKMIQSSKMASLGEMSAGVSHEINNPLAIIQGSAFRAIQNLSADNDRRDEVEGDLNRIIQNCDRIARIVRGLRAFSRSVDHEPFLPTPLMSIVDDVLNLAQERFKARNIRLHIELGPPTSIDCRPIQIGQVLMNLLNNAFDAVSENDINSRDVWIKSVITGSHVIISVEDSGAGIPPGNEDRILEPFFTTKEVGKGTGLGLSISKGIIESHLGRLWIDSESKRTRFVIELPIHHRET